MSSTNDRIDVAYVLSHGFAARMILHSAVIPELQKLGLSVAVIAPASKDDEAARLARERGVAFHPAPPVAARRASLNGQVRPYLHEDVRGNPALWAKHVAAVSDARRPLHNRARFHAYYALNRAVRMAPPLGAALRALDRANLGSPEADALLARIRPRAVVATYPVAPVEATLLLSARKLGIRTIGHLLSWDNITSKGYLSVLPDEFLVWGETMGSELQEFYAVERARIHRVGVPHFDAHVAAIAPQVRDDELRRIGLDPSKPYLLFGMSSPELVPFEIEVVEWLAAAVERNVFGADTQLVIRPHPQNITGNMADPSWLPRLDALVSRRVSVNRPRLQQSALAWNMDESDLPVLVNLLAGCAVCLNSGSTLSIDALLHDRPVVLPMFDATRAPAWYRSVRRFEKYIHLRRFLDLGGVRVAHDYDELTREVQDALAHPAQDAARRARARQAYLGPADGGASARTAAKLAQLLGHGRTEMAAEVRATNDVR